MTRETPDDAEALLLAEESFRHSWDMSDECLIDGAWVSGLCCECGTFVPYGQEVAHVAEAFEVVLARIVAEKVTAARAEGEALRAEVEALADDLEGFEWSAICRTDVEKGHARGYESALHLAGRALRDALTSGDGAA